MKYDIDKIDQFIIRYGLSLKTRFSYDEVMEKINAVIEVDDKEKLEREVERVLFDTERFLRDGDKFIYKPHFFENKKMIITPSEFEIEKGILFSGHRFAPFCKSDIFCSDISLICEDSNAKTATTSFEISINEASDYYTLLGSSEMLNVFSAEDHSNIAVIAEGNPTQKIMLTVFDLKKYYAEYNIELGDALIVTIKDWGKGIFSFDMIPKVDRNIKDVKKWTRILEKNLLKVFDEFDNYLDIPEQLLQAFFKDEKLLTEPFGSLEDFMGMSEKIHITFIEDRTILWKIEDDTNEIDNPDLPEGFSVSGGEVESLDDLLSEIKVPLSQIEIESYMRDELYNSRDKFESFFERCFGKINLEFIDEGQEAIFYNYIEDMWEYLIDTYDSILDAETGEVRKMILEIIDLKIEWFNSFSEKIEEFENIPEEKLKKLAGIIENSKRFLVLLNSEEKFQSREDAENIIEAIADIKDMYISITSDTDDA